MEANNEWHYKRLNKTTFSKAKTFFRKFIMRDTFSRFICR